MPGQVVDVAPWELVATHRRTMSRRAFERFKEAVGQDKMIRVPVKFVEFGEVKYIVDGHHRVQAARELGFMTVPGIRVELPILGYSTLQDLFEREQ